MSDPLPPQNAASTPLTDEERDGLKLSFITTRGDLNAAEQETILKAEGWASKISNEVLNRDFLNNLHQRMFGNVWKWAGKYRPAGKNIGVDAYRIQTDLQELIERCTYWIAHQTYERDEIAARFHHQLVSIHPYPNGNGRHSHLAADLLLKQMGKARFAWGSENLTDPGETKKKCIDALRAVDNHDYAPLIEFVRS